MLGLLVVALVLAASFVPLHRRLIALLPAAEAFIRAYPFAGVSAFVGFAALSAMLAFVSSAVIVPVGVYVWGKAISLVLLLLGWMLGGAGAYLLGRYFGRALVRAIVSDRILEHVERRLTAAAPFGLVVLFQLALPSEVPGYLLGLMRYDPRRFVAALGLAELPYAAAAIYLGEGFVDRNIRTLMGVGVSIVALSACALALLRWRAPDHEHGD